MHSLCAVQEDIKPGVAKPLPRGSQTPARGQKSARQGIFMCPFHFFKLHFKIILTILQYMIKKYKIKEAGTAVFVRLDFARQAFMTYFCALQVLEGVFLPPTGKVWPPLY